MQLYGPQTFSIAVTDSFLGDGSELWIHDARSITAGFVDDASAWVAGELKVQWGESQKSALVPVPAGNAIPLAPVAVERMPTVRLDGRTLSAAAGGDTLVLLIL